MVSSYSEGDYFADPSRHSEDAEFKAAGFLRLLLRFLKDQPFTLQSLVDVGCGSGDVVKEIARSLRTSAFPPIEFKGYDVSPHVTNIKHDGVEYVHGDFSTSDQAVDVVTLFDVFEHVPDPVEFLKSVSQRCRLIGLHIPLENSLNVAMRNLFRAKLRDPGHLVFMDVVSALNLLAMAGLRVVDYEYSPLFLAPSGHSTLFAKLVFPARYVLAKLNPWLLSKTFGGVSLTVIALTPQGLRR